MTSIPEIRKRLHVLADELDCPELHELAEATRRNPPVRKAPARSRPMHRKVGEAIRAYADANPRTSYQAIAEVFKVNAGRVSEALNRVKW